MDGYKGDIVWYQLRLEKKMIKWKALGLLIMCWYNKDSAGVSPLFFYLDEFFWVNIKRMTWSHREKDFAYVRDSLFPSLLSSFHSGQCIGVKMKDIPHREVM